MRPTPHLLIPACLAALTPAVGAAEANWAAASGTGEPELFDAARSVPPDVDADFFYDPDRCREFLRSEFGLTFATPDPSFNRLVRSTMLLQHDRVNEAGHLYESVGEISGISRYSSLMFPRTVGEAVYPMCAMGMEDDVERFYRYLTRIVPDDAPYWPHTLKPGAVASEKIQVDISADLLYGFAYLWLFTGDRELVDEFFPVLDRRARNIMDNHYHEELGLVDSGNYNEQYGGTRDRMAEIFTNMVTLKAYRLTTHMLEATGRPEKAAWYRKYADELEAGIRKHLIDSERGIFRAGFYMDSGRRVGTGWTSCYATRYHHWVDDGLVERTYDYVMRRTMGSFAGYEIWFGGGWKSETTSKNTGWRCGYLARNGRLAALDEELRFLADITAKPKDIVAEHYRVGGGKDYPYVRFGGRLDKDYYWTGYRTEPEGDFSVDSGNGEQTLMFLEDLLRKVAGVDWNGGDPRIAPRWPFRMDEVEVGGIRLPVAPGDVRTIDYRQTRDGASCTLTVRGLEGASPTVEVLLPGPIYGDAPEVTLNGKSVAFDQEPLHAARLITVELPSGLEKARIRASVQ